MLHCTIPSPESRTGERASLFRKCNRLKFYFDSGYYIIRRTY